MNRVLLHWRQILNQLSYEESPMDLCWQSDAPWDYAERFIIFYVPSSFFFQTSNWIFYPHFSCFMDIFFFSLFQEVGCKWLCKWFVNCHIFFPSKNLFWVYTYFSCLKLNLNILILGCLSASGEELYFHVCPWVFVLNIILDLLNSFITYSALGCKHKKIHPKLTWIIKYIYWLK